jgi:hypothetical protein
MLIILGESDQRLMILIIESDQRVPILILGESGQRLMILGESDQRLIILGESDKRLMILCELDPVLWIRICKDLKFLTGSGSVTRGYGSGFGSKTGLTKNHQKKLAI